MTLTLWDGSTPHTNEDWKIGDGITLGMDADGMPMITVVPPDPGEPTAGYVEVADDLLGPTLARRFTFQGAVVSVDPVTDYATFSLDGRYRRSGVTIPWSDIGSRPTDLNGYGITDAYTRTQLQTAGSSAFNATNLTSGTLPDGRLSANVAMRNAANVFTGYAEVQRNVAVTNVAFAARSTTDVEFRWRVNLNGTQLWGDGATPGDTNLYRSAANTLRTDDTFSAFALQIAGSTVINSSSQLVNVTGDAGIITSGTFADARIPSGISRVGHTHDMSDVFGELGVAKGGTGRQTVTPGAVLIGNPAGNTQPLQEVLPGAAGGFLVSWNGAWTRQSGIQWADISNPPVYATRWSTLGEIGAAAAAHTHVAQDITSGNFNVRLGWESPFTRGSASAIMAVGYNLAASGFNNTALPGALVLTTAFGSGLGNNMFTIKIVGRIHTGATNIELLISGYQTSVGGIANASITSNHRDFNYPVRLGFNAAGFLCVIIGGTSDTWSYPRLYVPYASIGYSSGPARGAQFEGWDFSAVTDLTGYTTLTPLTDESNAQYLNAQPASYYLDAGNLTGNLADARLSSNIPRLNVTNEFANWVSVRRSLVTEAGMAVWITGDTSFRWRVLAGGDMQWGTGTGAVYDTNLYRSAANTLRTDDTFSAFSFQIAGSTVINSSSQLVNVTASAAILTSGLLDINLIPSGISRVGHTHDVTDFYGSISVANGGTGRSSVTAGALLVGNAVGGSNPMQEVLPGADGGFLVSWSGGWTRQSGVQWADISAPSRPTTLAGYGITDAAPLAHGHEELAPVANYTYGAATNPRAFPQKFLYSFVRDSDGWPVAFGRLVHFGSLTSGQDGGAFQIIAPYSTGASYNNGKAMYRTGVYSNAGWSVWYTFASEAWATATFQPKSTQLSNITAPVTYGSISLAGSTGSYSGIRFVDSSTTLMVYRATDGSVYRQGFYRTASPVGWDWYFENGALVIGEVPAARITGILPAAQIGTVHSARHTFNGGIRLPDGTGAAPSLAVGQDDIGLWRYATNGVGLAGMLYVTRSVSADWDVMAQANSTHAPVMGNHSGFPGYAAWWRNGNANYAMIADANHLLLSANALAGAVYLRRGNVDVATFDSAGVTATGKVQASVGLFANAGASNAAGGLSLYSVPSNEDYQYGIMFRGTSSYGNHGYTAGTWAIYFTVATANRGWIFRESTSSTNVASIDATGRAHFHTARVADWFRNSTAELGLYNESTGHYWYSSATSGRWVSRSGTGIELRTTANAVKGYLLFSPTDAERSFGLADVNGQWRARAHDAGIVLYGGANTTTFSLVNGAAVLNTTNAGNYPYLEWQNGGTRGGYMGWGTPGSRLDLTLNNGVKLQIYGNNGSSTIAGFTTTLVDITPNLSVSGYVTASTFYTSSSRMFKEDIREFGASALDMIRHTRILRFRYRDNPVEQQVGFMAEDAPELFVTRDRLRMKPNSVISVALAGIQELEARVASLENENARLRAQLARMN